MKKQNVPDGEAQHLLKKMLSLGGADLAGSHQWISETHRWKELVFSLLTQTTKLSEHMVRIVTEHMFQLDMLSVPLLAKANKQDPNARRVVAILKEAGFTESEAKDALTVMHETAKCLAENYEGKIQIFLRAYGEQILRDMQKKFQFSGISKEAARYAFTFWLQNVLNMPVALKDKYVQAFSHDHGINENELFAAADELDINVAVVDDLVRYFHYDES